MLQQGALNLEELVLTVPCVTYGAHAAALTVALTLLARSLPAQLDLRAVTLRVAPASYTAVLRQGGAGLRSLAPLWAHVLSALRGCVVRTPWLRRLTLSAPPGVLPPDALQRLAAETTVAGPAVRLTVLAGVHTRAGRESPLRRLPAEVLGAILDVAAPKAPCQLSLQMPDLLDLGSSSSSSGSSSESESSVDGDSSSSSADEADSGG